jgi:prepilin-type N-terminal cleavage/methylation domain-containing protein
MFLAESENRRQTGFTLVELLVVSGIISLLTIAALASYYGGQRQYALSQAVQQLVSDIRNAQNMALGGVETSGFCSATSPCYGYGIRADSSSVDSYILFADKDNDQRYDSGEEIKTITLASQVEIKSIGPSSPLDVVFKPPAPATYINQNAGAGVFGSITLEVKGISSTGTVTVTTAGLIYSN